MPATVHLHADRDGYKLDAFRFDGFVSLQLIAPGAEVDLFFDSEDELRSFAGKIMSLRVRVP
jgi:hypothetical protein